MPKDAVAAVLEKFPDDFDGEGLPSRSQLRGKFSSLKPSRKMLWQTAGESKGATEMLLDELTSFHEC